MVQVPWTLPGFTEPLNFVSHSGRKGSEEYKGENGWPKKRAIRIPPAGAGVDLFPCALYQSDIQVGARLGITTLREFYMLRFMNEITDKVDWDVKIFDDTIAEKWKTEASQQQTDFTDRMADYCIDELRWRAAAFKTTGFVFVYNGDVVKSDAAVSQELKGRLQAAVGKLEADASRNKDYHPHSDGKVWDLVHPSLFPFVYGTSRILRDKVIGLDDCLDTIGLGEVVPVPSLDDAKDWEPVYRYSVNRPNQTKTQDDYSRKFQWLPCDVRFIEVGVAGTATRAALSATSGSGNFTCSITSYINNLHPLQHRDLYAVIEEIITAAIPLWNETLLSNEDGSRPMRIPYRKVEYEPDPETLVKWSDYKRRKYAEDDYGEALDEARLSCLVYPEPSKFESPGKSSSSTPWEALPLVERYSASGLQVIVKLATIELTPEKPSYEGGVWHVEGQLNEHICATALYYYACENITESRLGFRQMCDAHMLSRRSASGGYEDIIKHEQFDHLFLEKIFGHKNNEPGVQDVGSVVCKEGRLLTFPNTLQHKVLPFELADKSKPGHRKILALFLVDPNLHVISTSSVPPQRMDWWRGHVFTNNLLEGLTQELRDKISGFLDFPLTMEEAMSLRLELMEERKMFELCQSDQFESVKFSLCEH